MHALRSTAVIIAIAAVAIPTSAVVAHGSPQSVSSVRTLADMGPSTRTVAADGELEEATGPSLAGPQGTPIAGADAAITRPTRRGGPSAVYVTSPAFEGTRRLNAGFYYPSGRLHGAWDVRMSVGTKLYAVKDAVVIAAHDGVKNHPSGDQYGGMKLDSNYVLLCANVNGRPASLYYQHLSPGLKVKKGDRVTAGQYLGRSGMTGMTTGPHLHMSAQWGCASGGRYFYLRKPQLRIFSPSIFWGAESAWPLKPGVPSVEWVNLKRALHWSKVVDIPDKKFTKLIREWQSSHGFQPDGIVTREQYDLILNRAPNPDQPSNSE